MDKSPVRIKAPGVSVPLEVYPGHYIATHTHLNYYLDLTPMKTREHDAMEMARCLGERYMSNTIVDTIICMDGTQVVGSYLAQQLTNNKCISINAHNTIYVLTPEFDAVSQIVFRDNLRPMVEGQHVLLLMGNAITPAALRKSIECVQYYGGYTVGIAALFSNMSEIDGVPINAVYTKDLLPDYLTVPGNECPMCKQKIKLDALVNSFGYSKL